MLCISSQPSDGDLKDVISLHNRLSIRPISPNFCGHKFKYANGNSTNKINRLYNAVENNRTFKF